MKNKIIIFLIQLLTNVKIKPQTPNSFENNNSFDIMLPKSFNPNLQDDFKIVKICQDSYDNCYCTFRRIERYKK